MDTIFRKCNSYLTVVKIAQEEPRRYDKHGKPLVNYEETEEHRRRASAWSGNVGVGGEKVGVQEAEVVDGREDGEVGV